MLESQAEVNESSQIAPTHTVSYHYAAFRAGADGRSRWYDGVIQLNGVILTQEHYQALKNTLCQHYDIREDNFVITSLSRLDTLQQISLPSNTLGGNQNN